MQIPVANGSRLRAGARSFVDALRDANPQPGLSFSEVIDGFLEVERLYPDLNFFDPGGTLTLRPDIRAATTVRVELRKTEHLHLASILINSDQVGDLVAQTRVAVSSSWRDYKDALQSGLLFDPNNREVALHTKRDSNPWIELRFGTPIDIRTITLRNRNDARSARARGILVSARTDDGRWTTLYDGSFRERQFARDAERQYSAQLLAKSAAKRIRSTPVSRQVTRADAGKPTQMAMADLSKLLTLIRLQDLGTLRRDFRNLNLPDEDGIYLKSLINSEVLAPRSLEWNTHGVRRTFRFWTIKEKRHYIDFALSVMECLRELNNQVSLGFGSVLSVVRDQDLIPHDDDLDVIIGFEPSQARTLSAALDLVREHLTDNGFAAYGTAPANLNVRDRTNFKKLDVFVGIFEGDTIAWYPGKRGSLTREMIFPPVSLDLLGRNCPVPREPERYLREVYGENWETPDENFHHPFTNRKAEYESIQG